MKKSRSSLNRFELSKFDLQKIKELLKEKPRSSSELMKELGISSSVLKNRIDELMRRGEISTYEKPDDRRRRLYRIADEEKVDVSRAIYLATQFLEALENPTFKEKAKEHGGYRTSLSVFIEGKQPKDKLDSYASHAFRNMNMIVDAMVILIRISEVEKVAIVATTERRNNG